MYTYTYIFWPVWLSLRLPRQTQEGNLRNTTPSQSVRLGYCFQQKFSSRRHPWMMLWRELMQAWASDRFRRSCRPTALVSGLCKMRYNNGKPAGYTLSYIRCTVEHWLEDVASGPFNLETCFSFSWNVLLALLWLFLTAVFTLPFHLWTYSRP